MNRTADIEAGERRSVSPYTENISFVVAKLRSNISSHAMEHHVAKVDLLVHFIFLPDFCRNGCGLGKACEVLSADPQTREDFYLSIIMDQRNLAHEKKCRDKGKHDRPYRGKYYNERYQQLRPHYCKIASRSISCHKISIENR
ncbi:uncharacterized protein LOC109503815 [Harpegnathos saltator]|uniref:uncharacterized protein LOC109503815 n=1 Tax=Harpegnathos saltator TaxID=610380 RepID=UPI0009489424|nr:uncharacterized protein LOC109503815 [Harpegnathos saltator]